MKNSFSLSLLFLAAFLFVVTGCATTGDEWEKAAAEDTLEAYKRFLAQYPEGDYSDRARLKVAAIEWGAAKSQDTLSAYKIFLSNHPDGDFSDQARERIYELQWMEIESKYGNCEPWVYVAYPSVKIEVYKHFLAQYPEGVHSETARTRLREIEWTWTETIGIVKRYETFLSQYPTGDYSDQARERIREIKDRDAKWAELKTRLLKWEAEAPDVVKKGIHAIRTYDAVAKANAAIRLGKLGERAKGAIFVLIETLCDQTYLAKQIVYPTFSVPVQITPRTEAQEALALIGLPAVEPLILALNDKNPLIRSGAANVLGEVADRQAVGALIGALKDDNPKVRTSSATALGQIKDQRAIAPILLMGLTDLDKKVRGAAFNALSSIDLRWQERQEAKAAAPEIIPLLKCKDAPMRKSTAYFLGILKNSQAVDPLIDAMGDKAADVRLSAATALGRIKSDSDPDWWLTSRAAINILRHLVADLQDSGMFRKRQIVDDLEAITGQRFGADAEKWKNWWEEMRPKIKNANHPPKGNG